MSSSLIKIVMMWLCVSIVLYGLGVRVFEGDLASRFVSIDSNNQVTGLSSNFSSVIPIDPETNTVLGATGDFSFIDGLKLAWDFIKFIFNLVLAPIALLTFFDFPSNITMMIGIPTAIFIIFALIYFVRGIQT